MSAFRGLRGWLGVRQRFEFMATATMTVAMMAVAGALLLIPEPVLPALAGPPSADVAPQADLAPADPQIAPLHKLMESYGPVVVRQVCSEDGRVSVVLGHARQRPDIEQLAGEVEPAVTAVTGLWGRGWARAAVLVVASGPAEFAALTHTTGAVSDQVAAASVSDPFPRGGRPTGQRVVFAADAGRRLGPDGLRDTLRHELTHVAARAVTVDGAPQWVLEGFAEYAAHRGEQRSFAQLAPSLLAAARAGQLPAELPSDAAFVPGPGTDAALAYEQGWSVNAFVADRFGEPALVDLYRRLATGPADAAAVDSAVRAALGIGASDLVAHWRDWIRARAQ
ncbi:peptidase MA family metallohydrolase [Nocardia stercoris]|uniref:Peptidase MA-like domain-containing protein n=1 Tax=Nocardia stercoris TaxID=2483361 RepID=A0A3M2L3L3_9NOCA|nr:hypothetical protein [Nocardia stercoris]RMI29098.1 hypothetical protein EBN03_27060 [Nocardia stercoris]